MTRERFDQLVAAAVALDLDRARQEHQIGFAAPSDGPLRSTLATAQEALRAGMLLDEPAMLAEAYVFLGQAIEMAR